MNKEDNCLSTVMSEKNLSETNDSLTEENVHRHWQGVVKRRSFLKGLGIAGAALSAGSLVGNQVCMHRPVGAEASFPRAMSRFCDLRRQQNSLKLICGNNTTNSEESMEAIQHT